MILRKLSRIIASLLIICWLAPVTNAEVGRQDYFGARFKSGQGVEVSEETKKIIALQTTEVEEGSNGSQTITIIPASSILKTVTGTYVYVVNGKFFLRTLIKTKKSDGSHLEVLDGLFSGDEIVVQPVNTLWYTELQALRGGKACTEGH